jgi:hypothetical protein
MIADRAAATCRSRYGDVQSSRLHCARDHARQLLDRLGFTHPQTAYLPVIAGIGAQVGALDPVFMQRIGVPVRPDERPSSRSTSKLCVNRGRVCDGILNIQKVLAIVLKVKLGKRRSRFTSLSFIVVLGKT